MKKFIKSLLLVFLFTFVISSEPRSVYTFNSGAVYNDVADYNEIYGLEKSSNELRISSQKQKLKYLAVFIKFNDTATLTNHIDDSISVSNAQKIFNSDDLFEMNTVNGIIKVPSFKKYYQMQSYGKLTIETEIFPKNNDGTVVAYQDSKNMGYYLRKSASNPEGYETAEEQKKRETELINNAILAVSSQIDASGILPEEVDTDSDGIIDAISFFVEGKNPLDAGISWGDLLWSHKLDNYGLTAKIFNKKVIFYNLLYAYDYTISAGLFSLNKGTYGTILHEFGHTLGYADLYRFDRGGDPVGFYDMMGNGPSSNPQNFLSYFTSEYSYDTAWHDPLPVISKTTKDITLSKPEFIDASEKRAIKLQFSESSPEYFIVEYHEKQNTYASSSADSSGIIVYRVNDNNKYLGNKEGGATGEGDHIFIFRPNESALGDAKGDLTKATLNMQRQTLGKAMGKENGTFDNSTIYYADGTNSGIVINVKQVTDKTVTFDVTFPYLQGDGSKDNPYLIDDVQTFFYLMGSDTKDKYYKLLNDLDFAGQTYPKLDFDGYLEGNNKTLKNITATGTGVFDNVGNLKRASIVNLFIQNININPETGNHLGTVASVSNNAYFNNVHVLSGSVKNKESQINSFAATGGFIGSSNSQTTIENSSTAARVESNQNAGGFIGINSNAQIKNVFMLGEVVGNNSAIFIGVQYIMDNNYNYPTAYYDYQKNEGKALVGKYHALNQITEDALKSGINKITYPNKLTLKQYETLNYSFSYPNFVLESTDSNIVRINNHSIVGVNNGLATVMAKVSVGSHNIYFNTSIEVSLNEGKITENEVLNMLGLKKSNGYLVGFNLNEDINTIKSKINNISKVHLKSFENNKGVSVSSGIITTGMKIVLEFNAVEYTYITVIKGDVNGDGLIYATDYVKIKNHIMGKGTLTGPYLVAADINNDNNIYATDYVKIKNYIMGKGEIVQN